MILSQYSTPGLAALFLVGTMTLTAACGQDRGREEQSTEESTIESSSISQSVPEADVESNPQLEAAVANYQVYVSGQADQLVEDTRRFTDAVIAGNVEEAKDLYAPARAPWERIEPVAEKLEELDPRIDAREGDVPDEEWTGFHRIEQALWEQNTTDGQEEYARQLLADVESLREEVGNLQLEPEDLVNGSIELLNEVSAGKITGEEERYSHTDLFYDIQANVEGSEAAFEALEPALEEEDPDLVGEIEDRLDAVYAALEPYREGDGWAPYTDLSESERRQISQSIDALAEPLSRTGQALKT